MSTQEIAIKEMETRLIKAEETKPIKVSNNHCSELYIERVAKDLLQNNSNIRSRLPDNLPVESRKALEEMQKLDYIVIRPVDKGSKYFFLDRDDYVRKIHTHIHYEEKFQKVDKKKLKITANLQ